MNWSHSVREEYRLMMLEYKVLMGIRGCKKDEVREGRRKLNYAGSTTTGIAYEYMCLVLVLLQQQYIMKTEKRLG
jgi:hypothetical protein